MAKEYTQEELIELGKKAVARYQKDQEKAKILQKLWTAYKAGTITLPK